MTTLVYDSWWSAKSRSRDDAASDREAASIARLLKASAGESLLDVPCGTGRLAIPLALAGFAVTAVDHSAALLASARSAAEARAATVRWVERDMRDLPWRSELDHAICAWSSFGYLPDKENHTFLAAIATALVPGGHFFMDVPVIETVCHRLQERTWRTVDGGYLLQEKRFDHASGRLHRRWIHCTDGEIRERTTSLRLYSTRELIDLLHSVGLVEPVLYGDVEGARFSSASDRLFLVCAKGTA